MTLRRDRLVIIDIEATCWENNRVPRGMTNEIIEIGICTLTIPSRHIDDKRSILVRPVRSVVSEFCTQLTTLTAEQVAGGLEFAAACQVLVDEYSTRDHVWASWGNYDRRMFIEQCQTMDVPYPFSEGHINLKNLYAKLRESRRMGMRRALRTAGLDLIGTHHRGDDDAWNVARLTVHMLDTFGEAILLPYMTL